TSPGRFSTMPSIGSWPCRCIVVLSRSWFRLPWLSLLPWLLYRSVLPLLLAACHRVRLSVRRPFAVAQRRGDVCISRVPWRLGGGWPCGGVGGGCLGPPLGDIFLYRSLARHVQGECFENLVSRQFVATASVPPRRLLLFRERYLAPPAITELC